MTSRLVDTEAQFLPMDLPEAPVDPEITFKHIRNPLWTGNKARLIQEYLRLFVMITHHGTYIDGFAGPQDVSNADSWAAKLVLEFEPRWFRHFHLFELNKRSYKRLRLLCEAQPSIDSNGKNLKRTIEHYHGDFNELIRDVLADRPISDREATFCLLDQRTFECKWETVELIAKYKPLDRNKIEIFYFLPNSWIDRALAGLTKNPGTAVQWWGGSDPLTLRRLGGDGRRDLLCQRFREELGYRFVTPWPIYEKSKGRGAVMYYMIHATDHVEAPKLMERAFHKTVLPRLVEKQLELFSDQIVQDGVPNSDLTISK